MMRWTVLICAMSSATGLAAQEIDCDAPLTQGAMNHCAYVAWQAADAELNRVYRPALTAMKDIDSYLPEDQKGAEAALRTAQRAWILYRDARCETEAYFAKGGTMESLLRSGCLETTTHQRIQELRSLYEM